MSALRLNVWPAVVDGPPSDVAHYVPHDDELFKSLRELERSAGSFHCFRLSDRIYVWPKPGGAIPNAVDLSHAGTITAADTPSRALAHAVREAAADFMVGEPHGFERLRGRSVDPVRLFRRRRNLAAGAGVQLADEAGVFPYLMLQGIVLQQETPTVALVVDVGLVNRLDVPLRDLQAAGIDLAGMNVDWQHEPNCSCPEPHREGRAGVIVGGDPEGVMQVKPRWGDAEEAAARCLCRAPASRDGRALHREPERSRCRGGDRRSCQAVPRSR